MSPALTLGKPSVSCQPEMVGHSTIKYFSMHILCTGTFLHIPQYNDQNPEVYHQCHRLAGTTDPMQVLSIAPGTCCVTPSASLSPGLDPIQVHTVCLAVMLLEFLSEHFFSLFFLMTLVKDYRSLAEIRICPLHSTNRHVEEKMQRFSALGSQLIHVEK